MRGSLRAVALTLLVALSSVGAGAQTLLDTTLVLGKKPDPVILPFNLPAAGSYRMTVTDFGTAAAPVRLGRVDAGIMRGSALVTAVNLTNASSSAVVTKTFAAAAGEHRLVLAGQPAAPALVGSVGVRIDDPANGAVLLDTLQAFTVASPPTASPADFEHEFAATAGSYTLEITDFALPQPLAVLYATVIRKSAGSVMFNGPVTAPIALTLGADDTFEIFIHTELAGGAARGLVGVNLRDAATDVTKASAVHELGEWPYRYAFDLPADASVTVTLTDLGFPFPLASLAGETVRDGRRALPRLTPPAALTASAVAGNYVTYVDALAPTTGPGSFGVRVTPAGAASVLDTVQNVVVPGPVTDVGTVNEAFDIATAGNYTLTLTDFGTSGFFDAFTSVALSLTRDDQVVGTLTMPGDIAFTAVPGHYNVAVIADPAGTAGDGLLGIAIHGGPGDATVFDRTAAVGTDFISAQIDVASANDVNVALTDLAFPAPFDSIRVAVTRGATRVGEIVGAGTFEFAAMPGRYLVNLLAKPSGTVGYSTLGVNASVASPAPAITLAASSPSVTVGKNVTLTWSAANATSCTASGSWSGAKALTGSESIGPLNTNATYTLTCAGPGGDAAASVSVAVTQEQRSGGGGAVDPGMLVLLALAVAAAGRRRIAA
jgi:hypothetical protein